MECAALLLPSNVKKEQKLGAELLHLMIQMLVNDIESNIDNKHVTFTYAPNTSYCHTYMKLHFVHATLFA
jgi:hypothetical protein